jgi:hypothetical protein
MNKKFQAASSLPPPRLGREALPLPNEFAITGAEKTNLVSPDFRLEVSKTRVFVATRGEPKPDEQPQ